MSRSKWRGEEGESRDITYAWLLEQTQRAANALKHHGVGAGDVVGICPAPAIWSSSAMLACSRIGAPQRRPSAASPPRASERMAFSDAKAPITVDERAPQGQGGASQAVRR